MQRKREWMADTCAPPFGTCPCIILYSLFILSPVSPTTPVTASIQAKIRHGRPGTEGRCRTGREASSGCASPLTAANPVLKAAALTLTAADSTLGPETWPLGHRLDIRPQSWRLALRLGARPADLALGPETWRRKVSDSVPKVADAALEVGARRRRRRVGRPGRRVRRPRRVLPRRHGCDPDAHGSESCGVRSEGGAPQASNFSS